MKKFYVIVMAIFLMAATANSQSNYIRFGLGGGIGLKQYDVLFANGYIGLWADQTQTDDANNVEMKSMGLGGGFNVNLAFGHMFSQYVGLELGVNQFIGMKKKIHQAGTTTYSEYSSDVKLSGMMLQIVPALVITPGLEKVNPYARIGMIIGALSSVTEQYSESYTSSGGVLKYTMQTEAKIKDYGGIAMGFTAAGGVTLNLSEKLDFYGELVFNGINYSPSKGKFKEWTEDGVDQLATATTKEKEWTYEKKYNSDEDIPDGNPDKYPKTTFNFSNVELNIGIKFKL